jgi:hypothetical protein
MTIEELLNKGFTADALVEAGFSPHDPRWKKVKTENELKKTKDNWDATVADLARAEADIETTYAKLLGSEAALAITQQNLTVCTSQEHLSGSKKGSGSAGIAVLSATLVVVVVVAVAHIRKLAGQVANLNRQEAQRGCRDTLPMTSNPMVQLEPPERPYEQYQIGREAEYEARKAADAVTYTDLDGNRQQYSNLVTGTTA